MGNNSLSLERVLDQNSILAFRAGGKQGDRAANKFLDPADIFDRLRRQIGPGAGVGGRLLPAFDGLVNRLQLRLLTNDGPLARNAEYRPICWSV